MQTPDERTQKALDKEIGRQLRVWKRTLQQNFAEYLTEDDPETGLSRLHTIVAYAGQGYEIQVGVGLTAPEKPTELEERAAASGIEIVKA